MIVSTTYKKQGNGQDSWIIMYDDKVPEIVYEDPSIQRGIDMSKVDLSTMTKEQMEQLKQALGL